MNSGIVRNALTTTLALELKYREPSDFSDIGNALEHPQNSNTQGDHLKKSLRAS
jgi:hypothetical protein